MRETLLLLPGLLCDSYTFAAQRDALSSEINVVVPLFWGLDRLEDMAALALDSATGKLAVLGFSMGGRVAMEMWRQAPDRIARIGLMDTGTHAVRPGEPEKRQELIDLAYREGMAALAARWLPPMVHPDRVDDPALIGPLTEMVCRATPEIHEKQLQAQLRRPDTAPLLPTINVPSLVVVGRQDAWSTPAQHEEMTRLIPGAKLVVIEESGHFVPVEQPGALTSAIRGWLPG
jgi:pimeloyl-ACP methyl ester carboxylesterase